MRALRLPARASGSLILFGCRFHALLHSFVLAEALLGRVEDASQAWNNCSSGVPFSGLPRPWTRAGSHRFPGDPSHTFVLLQDPGRAGETSPLAVSSVLPPDPKSRRPQREENIEANVGLQYPLSTLHERRRRPHARLASGWRAAPLPGGCRTLWIASKGFRLHPSSFPGFILSQFGRRPSRNFSLLSRNFSLLGADEFPCSVGIHRLFAWRGTRFLSHFPSRRLLIASQRAPIGCCRISRSDEILFS